MNSRLGSTVINCIDIDLMTTFWSRTLSLTPSSTEHDDRFRVLRGSWGNLSLQLSDVPVSLPTQLHLDLYTDDYDTEVTRVLGLGATQVRSKDDAQDTYTVLRDPEHHEFCICAARRRQQRYVAVVGPSAESLRADGDSEAVVTTAYQVGRLLAARQAIVLCGGGTGVMAAVADGVADGNGISIGVLPGPDRSEAHPNLSIALPTGLGELRNGLLIRFAEAVIAVGGSWGTLSEIALAARNGTPVVSLLGWTLPDAVERHTEPDDAVAAVWDRLPT